MVGKLNIFDLDSVREGLSRFIWSFLHGDNIFYNFMVLEELYESSSEYLIKPKIIITVSIIEAILIDFIKRLDGATSHQPDNFDPDKLEAIQKKLGDWKKIITEQDDTLGEVTYVKFKLKQYNQIVSLMKDYELFGEATDPIYEQLNEFGKIRNRVHIENYFNHDQLREERVFTFQRLTEVEILISDLWDKMISDYARPWKDGSSF